MERRNKILRFLYVTIESALFAFIVMMVVLLLIFICISFITLQYVNMIIGINNQYLPEPTDFVLKAEEKDVIFSTVHVQSVVEKIRASQNQELLQQKEEQSQQIEIYLLAVWCMMAIMYILLKIEEVQ